MFVPPPPHFYFPLELYVYITLTNNYLAFFIYQLIILWTILINWHRWLLLNNHTSKYNSFILVLCRRYKNHVSVCPPPPPPPAHTRFGTLLRHCIIYWKCLLIYIDTYLINVLKSTDIRAVPTPVPLIRIISATSRLRRKYLPTMIFAVAMVMPLPSDMTTQWLINNCSGWVEKARNRQPRAQIRPPITAYSRGLFLRHITVMKGVANSDIPRPTLPSHAGKQQQQQQQQHY